MLQYHVRQWIRREGKRKDKAATAIQAAWRGKTSYLIKTLLYISQPLSLSFIVNCLHLFFILSGLPFSITLDHNGTPGAMVRAQYRQTLSDITKLQSAWRGRLICADAVHTAFIIITKLYCALKLERSTITNCIVCYATLF